MTATCGWSWCEQQGPCAALLAFVAAVQTGRIELLVPWETDATDAKPHTPSVNA